MQVGSAGIRHVVPRALGAEHLRDVFPRTCIVGLASVPVAVIRGRSVRPRKGAFTGNVVEANPQAL